ncbi:hypothetical protein D3C77_709430 [compost metagenome]
MVIAQQVEDLQQGLVRQAVGIAAVAHEEFQQPLQGGVILLAGQLLDSQLVDGFVVAGILGQA